MEIDEIIEIFKSDMFDGDVYLQISYIQEKSDYVYCSDELFHIYDNLEKYNNEKY